MTYADTSFLFSLVMHDANTAVALSYLRKHPTELALTPLQRFELGNALRLSVWRGNSTPAELGQALSRIEADLTTGNLVEAPLAWPELMAHAEKLSAKHTAAIGVRSLDLLHVSAAISLEAKRVLTCDLRQLALARAAGLNAAKV